MSILTLTGVSKSFGGQKVLDGLTMQSQSTPSMAFSAKTARGKPRR